MGVRIPSRIAVVGFFVVVYYVVRDLVGLLPEATTLSFCTTPRYPHTAEDTHGLPVALIKPLFQITRLVDVLFSTWAETLAAKSAMV